MPHCVYHIPTPSPWNHHDYFVLCSQLPVTCQHLSLHLIYICMYVQVYICIYTCIYCYVWGFPRWLSGKESFCQCRRRRRWEFDPWVRKIPWSRKWKPTPVFLPGKSRLAGYSPWGQKRVKHDLATKQQTSKFKWHHKDEVLIQEIQWHYKEWKRKCSVSRH